LRIRTPARRLAAGALCLAATGAVASAARAQAPTAQAAKRPQIKLHERRLDVKAGRRAVVAGRLAPAVAGVRVALQVHDGRRWTTIDRTRTRAAGTFALRRRLHRTGSRPARVRTAAAPGVLAGKRRLGRLDVFRFAHASWYGPGLYGNRLGCGGRLYPGRLGVAHKSLPCGTRVTFKHGRRAVRVRVIDRGPYVGGREYDLTQATAQRLGFSGHGAILTTR
jgi:hypothetical protein